MTPETSSDPPSVRFTHTGVPRATVQRPPSLRTNTQNVADKVEQKGLYAFNRVRDKWSRFMEPVPATTLGRNTEDFNSFALITYNIDCMTDMPDERLEMIVSYLERHTIVPLLLAEPPVPTIVLIQELECEAIDALLAHPCVRAHYCVPELTGDDWKMYYGTITLIPLALAPRVRSVYRTPFRTSTMGRSALYVDIAYDPPEKDDENENPRADVELEAEGSAHQQWPRQVAVAEGKILRIANVHLESLRGPADTMRIEQLESVVSYLRAPGVIAGVVAGDMNPIGPYDDGAPAKLGLRDVWETCRSAAEAGTYAGGPKSEWEWKGHTWGYQSNPQTGFPPRRMDKILLLGGLMPRDVEVIGKGIMVNEYDFVSDHFGVVSRIDIIV